MNPDNPVVVLCSQGMQAEAEGRDDDARDLFRQAWETAADDYEACIAAHYLARHQPTAHDTLHWNQECLKRADRVADDRVKGFYASLHLNIAHAHRDLDSPEQTREHFTLAAERLADVPPGPYADGLRLAAAEGLRACGALPPNPAAALLDSLAAALCDRRDLKSLSLLLPSLLGDLGTPDDRLRLSTALHTLHATRTLPDSEQAALRQAVTALS
ncbi:hypothetical protein [Actinocorallia populi]|uniref:hypothetical protein n=1 Tax=Actinocorallia populi TaxID=2079200 RepID=UPI000D08694E|nr:hypothetical protein [Actinocorallia populi]